MCTAVSSARSPHAQQARIAWYRCFLLATQLRLCLPPAASSTPPLAMQMLPEHPAAPPGAFRNGLPLCIDLDCRTAAAPPPESTRSSADEDSADEDSADTDSVPSSQEGARVRCSVLHAVPAASALVVIMAAAAVLSLWHRCRGPGGSQLHPGRRHVEGGHAGTGRDVRECTCRTGGPVCPVTVCSPSFGH